MNDDIKAIPYLYENFDDVLYVERPGYTPALVYVAIGPDDSYYLESYLGERTITGKQFIKVPNGEIPRIRGIESALNKTRSTNSSPSELAVASSEDATPGTYVRNVWNNASDGSITDEETHVNSRFSLVPPTGLTKLECPAKNGASFNFSIDII